MEPSVWAFPGRLSGLILSVFHSKSVMYGAFVWARRALNRPKWRFPARAAWNADWGEAGYVRLLRGGRADPTLNLCGVAEDVTHSRP
jgi:hypothetical protein